MWGNSMNATKPQCFLLQKCLVELECENKVKLKRFVVPMHVKNEPHRRHEAKGLFKLQNFKVWIM